MKRFVYTPRVDAYIQADTGLYDVSPYIVRGNVTRRVNAVSTVNLTLRNPNFIWTNHERTGEGGAAVLAPVFHPMDKITVTLTRIKDRPVQVFTGFLDTAPYISAYPGTVDLTASCTLKRLQYTYFDPGLPFFHQFLKVHGWESNRQYGITNLPSVEDAENADNLNDSSFGQLLFDVLTEIGGWDPETIFIEKLPEGIVDLVAKMFNENKEASEEAFDELKTLLKDIVGTAELSGMAATGTSGGGPPPGGGWKGIIATVYGNEGKFKDPWTDPWTANGQGSCGRITDWSYGEIGNTALGGLPCGYRYLLYAKQTGRQVVVEKKDRNNSDPGDGRKMDIWIHTARYLWPNASAQKYNSDAGGFGDPNARIGVGTVYIKRIPQNTPLGPYSGG